MSDLPCSRKRRFEQLIGCQPAYLLVLPPLPSVTSTCQVRIHDPRGNVSSNSLIHPILTLFGGKYVRFLLSVLGTRYFDSPHSG